jgi:hypothetical protein
MYSEIIYGYIVDATTHHISASDSLAKQLEPTLRSLEPFFQSSHLLLVIDPHWRAGLTLKSGCSVVEKLFLSFVEQRRVYTATGRTAMAPSGSVTTMPPRTPRFA